MKALGEGCPPQVTDGTVAFLHDVLRELPLCANLASLWLLAVRPRQASKHH